MDGMTLHTCLSDHHKTAAARMFLDAFAGKLGPILGRDERAERFVFDCLSVAFAISAVDTKSGALLGVAGFKTSDGAFVSGGWAQLRSAYGSFGAAWRAVALSLLERETEPGVLLMDGIFVEPAHRGRGVGKALLGAITDHAVRLGLSEVRLDVIDENPRARALYERVGFVAGAHTSLGPLRHIFGFSGATTMRLAVADRSAINAP